MRIPEPFTDLTVKKARSGFYKGHNRVIALASKFGVSALVIWALVWPVTAGRKLAEFNGALLDSFNGLYIVLVGAFSLFCFALAVIPATGRQVLGRPGERPEFSNFSWFSMMFGAGLGVGLMVYSTAEPVRMWASNPVILTGGPLPNSPEAVQSAFRYTFMHYGFHAWSIYVTTGLALAFYAFRRGMPLTIRSALTPVMGRFANTVLGDLVDVLGVVATILGVAVTIGYGVSQLVDGFYSITGAAWLVDVDGDQRLPSATGLIVALATVMGMSIVSAVSGVDRGIRYLSNLNLVLSFLLLATFVVAGSFLFAMTTYGTALLDYVLHFLELSFDAQPTSTAVGQWQSSEGTTFYWAWWIAFAPFVGLFLARISRGRTIREFVLGAVIAPSLVCFAWMAILGGTAIDLELSGVAGGAIIDASITAKLFATMQLVLDGGWLRVITSLSVLLIVTFLVTSADSGILVMNTIMSGGSIDTDIRHRVVWGVILTLLIAALLLAGGGGFGALQDAMIIGALPFLLIMALMCVALAKALYRDNLRERHGIPVTCGSDP